MKKPNIVVYVCNSSTWELEAGGSWFKKVKTKPKMKERMEKKKKTNNETSQEFGKVSEDHIFVLL